MGDNAPRASLPIYSHRFLVEGVWISGPFAEVDGLVEEGGTSTWSEMSAERPLVLLDRLAETGQLTLRRPLPPKDRSLRDYWKAVQDARRTGGDLSAFQDKLRVSILGKGAEVALTFQVSKVLPTSYTPGRQLLATASGFATEELVVMHQGIEFV